MTVTRLSRLREHIEPGQYFFVTGLINIRYLTGFTGSNAALLVSNSDATFATDARYEIQARAQVPELQTLIGRDFPDLLLGKLPNSEVLVEGSNISLSAFQSLTKTLPHNFITTRGVIEQLRVIKDESEIKMIQTACEISTQAFLDIIWTVQVGQSEKLIRNALENRIRELGADGVAFDSIVATGSNSAIAHHEPSDREIQMGDLLKIDFGAKLSGYHSDCTRTAVLGKPSNWQVDLHAAVSTAQLAGRNVIRSDVKFKEVEQAVSQSMTESGYRKYFTHGLGHGVGLEIHEEPFFGRAGDTKIVPNTVITIEPGAYLDDKGGVRVEDTIVVDSQGHRNLTNLPYELLVL